MKGIGVSLVLVGLAGILMGMAMFGDIGIAAMTAGLVGILSGIGFIRVGSKLAAQRTSND